MKKRAITKDEESIAKRVTGKKNINSPAIPGQKINGKKAASVVEVEANTGINIFFADRMKTFFLLIPSLALLFAYSTTIIAPSIKIPTDRISEKRTTTLIVTSKKDKMIIDKRKEKGIEILTKIEDFKPIKNKVIIKTIIVASITLFSKSLTCVMIFSDSS
jgi:hypothetical protein